MSVRVEDGHYVVKSKNIQEKYKAPSGKICWSKFYLAHS